MFTAKRSIALAMAMALLVPPASAQDAAATPSADAGSELQAKYQKAVAGGIGFLTSRQASDGSYSKQLGPAITALATTALLRHGRGVSDPTVARSLRYLESFVRPDGGIHSKDSLYKNYETCITVMCFTEANKDGRYDKILKGADRFLKKLQWDEGDVEKSGKKIDKSSTYYGGQGYGKHGRPDLSNTQMFIEALRSLGNDENDPHMKKALEFVSKCQNHESTHNPTPHAAKVNDGGFYYTPAEGGSSQAGTTANGGLRSYASMTYAGLKSMIYCGLKKDDPRVKAATDWISKHYDLDSNPGMGTAGLYYYYHTFAKALDAMKIDEFVDSDGKKHNWRQELITELVGRQQPSGSWINDSNERWLEQNGDLVTAYALLALSYCRKK